MLLRSIFARTCNLGLLSTLQGQPLCRSLTTVASEPETASPSTSEGSPTKSALVHQYLGPDYLSRAGKLKYEKQQLIKAFQLHEGDLGSTPVQVALLTNRIRGLEPHFQEHKHDHHSMRGLQALLQQRRRLLRYLRGHDFRMYMVVLHKLGLKDIYGKQHRLDKYRVGTRLPHPTGAIKRYKQQKKK